MTTNEHEDESRRWLIGGALVVAAVLGFFIVVAAIRWPQVNAEWGQRGDWWGGHFSAAGSLSAAVLLFVAVMLQRGELRLQRMELRQAREVSGRQAEHLKEQAAIAKRTAALSRIIELMQYQANLQIQSLPEGWAERAHWTKQVLESTLTFRQLLLSDEAIEESERESLKKVFDVLDQERFS